MSKGQILYYIYVDCYRIGADPIMITGVYDDYFKGIDSDGCTYTFKFSDIGDILFYSPEEGIKNSGRVTRWWRVKVKSASKDADFSSKNKK